MIRRYRWLRGMGYPRSYAIVSAAPDWVQIVVVFVVLLGATIASAWSGVGLAKLLTDWTPR